jgi:hypothetical protein
VCEHGDCWPCPHRHSSRVDRTVPHTWSKAMADFDGSKSELQFTSRMSVVALVHPGETFTVTAQCFVSQCGLFNDDPSLLAAPSAVRSPVPLPLFRTSSLRSKANRSKSTAKTSPDCPSSARSLVSGLWLGRSLPFVPRPVSGRFSRLRTQRHDSESRRWKSGLCSGTVTLRRCGLQFRSRTNRRTGC